MDEREAHEQRARREQTVHPAAIDPWSYRLLPVGLSAEVGKRSVRGSEALPVQRVVHLRARAIVGDEPRILEHREMLRHRRLADGQARGQRVHAVRPLEEEPDDAEAGGRGEGLEYGADVGLFHKQLLMIGRKPICSQAPIRGFRRRIADAAETRCRIVENPISERKPETAVQRQSRFARC